MMDNQIRTRAMEIQKIVYPLLCQDAHLRYKKDNDSRTRHMDEGRTRATIGNFKSENSDKLGASCVCFQNSTHEYYM